MNFIERKKVKNPTFLVSMDVTSLFIQIYITKRGCWSSLHSAVWKFLQFSPPIPTHYLREMLRLILKENCFQLMGSSTHKLTVPRWAQGQRLCFANIFMAHIETQSLSKIVFRPTVWKRYMDDIFLLWDSKLDIVAFFEQANLHYPTIKFTTEIHWDNVFRRSCLQRHKIQRKSYAWCKDTF